MTIICWVLEELRYQETFDCCRSRRVDESRVVLSVAQEFAQEAASQAAYTLGIQPLL